MSVHGRSEPAPGGEANQDAFVVTPTRDGGLLLLVCDGMGGMGRGADASRLATTRLEQRLADGADGARLRDALVQTDHDLRRELVMTGPGAPGCTAVAMLVKGDRVTVGWAGDARGLHLRGGTVQHATIDHKLVEELIASGTLSREEARSGRLGHVVTRCLGGRKEGAAAPEPEISEAPWTLLPGDALVLCSDGLTDVLDQEDIAALVEGRTAHDAVDALVQAAHDRQTTDDTTVVVYRHPLSPGHAPSPSPPRQRSRPSDPLLDLSAPTVPPTTWPPPDETPTPAPSTMRTPTTDTSTLSWVLLALGAFCVLLALGILAAWFGGLI